MSPKQLTSVRKRLDLNKTQLARELGVKPAAVSRWESGERDVPEYIAKLVRLVEKDLRARATA